jgi:glutathione reductase (NADPH)
MTAFDFDLFVIGGGSGGVRAARIAATHGARVAIAEEYRFGGTCVIRGCVPKKLLVYASRFHDEFEDARGFGWDVASQRFDWRKLIAAKDNEIARLEGIYARNLEKAGVALFRERATLTGPTSLRLGTSGRTVTAGKILIATGGRVSVDRELVGAEHAITSNEAFHLERLPESVLMIGGGYIALEFAGIFAGLGARVTVTYRGSKILRGFDEDLRDGLTEEYRRRGIEILTDTQILKLDKHASGVTAHLSSGERRTVACVMAATGRVPNTTGLGLDVAGVATGRAGAIVVDEQNRTNVASIYAVGDVTNRMNLTPVAIREGHAFADTVFGKRPWRTTYDNIPTAVFTTPEIGTVGLSEAEARASGGAIDIYKTRFRPMKGTLSGREERMVMKLVVDQASGRVLGVHVLGPDAAEMVQIAAIALNLGATKADFDRTMPLHPSAAEELVTLREKWVPLS